MTPTAPSAVAPSLEVDFGKFRLRNPVLAASGCFGYGGEYTDFIDNRKIGEVLAGIDVQVNDKVSLGAEALTEDWNHFALPGSGLEVRSLGARLNYRF